MQYKDKDKWEEALKNNEDGRIDDYGGAILFAAQHWANLMECHIANGRKIEDIANMALHRADEDMEGFGLTGFQYGAVVAVLAETWIHGEELRIWHNLQTQIGNEGERANEEGTVLNPALLKASKQ